MKVILFAQLAELTGSREILVNGLPDTDSLIEHLKHRYDGFDKSVYVIAVGKEIIRHNTALDQTSVVAILPPYSGG
jgi:molybdopterin converting factor small subunit